MGKFALILVFVLVIIIGAVLITLTDKQLKSVDDVWDLDHESHVRHLANSLAEDGMKQLTDWLNNGNFVAFDPEPLPNYNEFEDFQGEDDSIVYMNIFNGFYEEEYFDLKDFVVESVAELTAPDGSVYTAQTNAYFEYLGEIFPTNPDKYFQVMNSAELYFSNAYHQIISFENNAIRTGIANKNVSKLNTSMASNSSFRNGTEHFFRFSTNGIRYPIEAKGPFNVNNTLILLQHNTDNENPLEYPINLIVHGKVRIDHALHSRYHINIIATDSIYVYDFANRPDYDKKMPPENTRLINANLYSGKSIIITNGYTHDSTKYRRMENISITEALADVNRNASTDVIGAIEAWEERPVVTLHRNEETEGEDGDLLGLINLNTATLAELMTLNGIGAVKAQAIIDFRNKNGLYKRIEDVQKVKGIGKVTFNNIKDRLTV